MTSPCIESKSPASIQAPQTRLILLQGLSTGGTAQRLGQSDGSAGEEGRM